MTPLNEIQNVLPVLGGVMAGAAWRSVLLLAVMLLAVWSWRRSPAAGRHLVWTMTFVCLLGLPVLLPCLPKWQSPLVIPADTWNNRIPDQLKFMFGDFAPEPVAPAPGEAAMRAMAPVQAPVQDASFAAAFPLEGWLAALWLAGMLFFGLRIVVTQSLLNRMARKLSACDQRELLDILEEMRRQYGIRRPLRLLVFTAASPMTWGYWRPVIALPVEALDWPEERLRVVLRHELAHVRRRDWLTQELARLACALYWFNPLVWLAARQMRAEREQACDDYVLNSGTQPTAYATHLVEIARQFTRPERMTGAVAMARPSGLEQRIHAILDDLRQRRALGRKALVAIAGTVLSAGLLIAGCSNEHKLEQWSLEHSKVAPQLKAFFAEKTAQANAMLAADAKDAEADPTNSWPDTGSFFAAAAKGDWLTVSNRFQEISANGVWSTSKSDHKYPRGRWFAPVVETLGAYEQFEGGSEKYCLAFGDGIIQSIPPGSIYFGGTDPGRFLVTALQKSHADGDPFFTLTQNALADGNYLKYLQSTYGDKIHMPTADDSAKCFEDFTKDAAKRVESHQLKPGEQVSVTGGKVQISGQVAVMEINGLISKLIFDKNPDHDFYIEVSFPLDWMYPYLEPHGLIMKLNRQPTTQLSDVVVQTDQDFWAKEIQSMVGDWLHEDTSVNDMAAFVKKTFVQHDYSGFTGDRVFMEDSQAQKTFSKLRSSIAQVYAWRADQAPDAAERDRMTRAADYAYREAYALCPYSPEALFGYVGVLAKQNRTAEALVLAETSVMLDPKNTSIHQLIATLKRAH
ncbi:MAG TPA: M56 family metallopeptidase [Dongiaceae bacterium]|nr:M56 family metallopeptidase [Dongiaceae bacterium]